MKDYVEVRCNFYNDIKGCWCVDAWMTDNDNEEGKVVAEIYDNGGVVYIDVNAMKSPNVQEVIKSCLMGINGNK